MSGLPQILEASLATGRAFLVKTETNWPVSWKGETHKGRLWLNSEFVKFDDPHCALIRDILTAQDWVMGRGEYHDVVWRDASQTLIHYGVPIPAHWEPDLNFWDLLKS